MIQAIPSQKSFDADLVAANTDQIVVLHRWADGMILVMVFDDEMPAFTTKPIPHGEKAMEPIRGKDALTTATGYVFWVIEPDAATGPIEFDGRKYAFIDIYDYVTWTDEGAVRAKYEEVKIRAMAE